jgi:hypothetical protein
MRRRRARTSVNGVMVIEFIHSGRMIGFMESMY